MVSPLLIATIVFIPEEFRPDNLDSKNQENDGSNQRNPGGFGNSRPRGGGNFRGGRGFRGAFRGRTFSRGGGGGGFGGNFRNDRGDRPPPFPQSYEGGEIFNNSEMDNNNKGKHSIRALVEVSVWSYTEFVLYCVLV